MTPTKRSGGGGSNTSSGAKDAHNTSATSASQPQYNQSSPGVNQRMDDLTIKETAAPKKKWNVCFVYWVMLNIYAKKSPKLSRNFIKSYKITLQSLHHGVVVPSGHSYHLRLIDGVCDALDALHCGCDLLLLFLGNVQHHVGCSFPLCFDHVPHLLDGVERTTLRRQILSNKCVAIELKLYCFGVMHRQIIHNNDCWSLFALLFQSLYERQECVCSVASSKGLSMD